MELSRIRQNEPKDAGRSGIAEIDQTIGGIILLFEELDEKPATGSNGPSKIARPVKSFGKIITKCIFFHGYNYASVVWKVVWETAPFVVKIRRSNSEKVVWVRGSYHLSFS